MNPVARVKQIHDELFVDPLVGTLPEVKTLGASWDALAKAWVLPATLASKRGLDDLLLSEVEYDDSVTVEEIPTVAVADERLFDFQAGAVGRLVAAPRGMLLCASPGLGKTIMAIVAADQKVPDDQVVVVCPSSLLRTWQREISAWSKNTTSYIVKGTSVDWDEVQKSRWLLTSWDTLAIHQDWFLGHWPLWIFDESVLVKSRDSDRAYAVTGGTKRRSGRPAKKWVNLRKTIDAAWLLSGSPITRHADDLWQQLNIIYPRAFKSYWRFAERYCEIEDSIWSANGKIVATRRDRDAVADNADLIMVINQEDVLDLPEYLFEVIDVDLTWKQKTAYQDMERNFLALLDSGDLMTAASIAAQLTRLQQITSYFEGESAKHDALIQLMRSQHYETPMLVWTHWKEGAKALTGSLTDLGYDAAHVSGDSSDKDKDHFIELFKRGKLDILVLSLGVGKFGHTMTNTKTVIYVDKSFSADDYYQSLRRVRRIGLTHSPVVVTIRAPGTVDELVELNLEGKVASISRIAQANLSELLKGIGRRKP